MSRHWNITQGVRPGSTPRSTEKMFSLSSLRAHCQINGGSLRPLRNLSQFGMALETLYLGPIRVRSSESPNGQARLASLVRHLKWKSAAGSAVHGESGSSQCCVYSAQGW